jgi:molybdopterin molybdotransferase
LDAIQPDAQRFPNFRLGFSVGNLKSEFLNASGYNSRMPNTASNASVLPFEQARQSVEAYARSIAAPPTESVPLLETLGRVLAYPIEADRDLPPFHRSTRDGFAVHASDVHSVPAKLRCVGELRAGDPASKIANVNPGECIEIMTGAAVPQGADAVVMVEYTSRHEDIITVTRSVASGENIVPRASEAKEGDTLVERGTRVNHAVVALAATTGSRRNRTVYTRPIVAILSTGDELVDVDSTPAPHQIRNSNSYSLAAQIKRSGADPRVLPIAVDEPRRLAALIEEGLSADLLLITGGVSMGKYDFVEQVLAKFDNHVFFTGAMIQPGKPVVFLDALRPGSTKRIPVFGLPGNPVSTMVTFELFVRPVLDALCGATPRPLRYFQSTLASDVKAKTGLTRFLPAQLSGEGRETRVALTPWQGSGDVVSVARSNCYIVIPPDRDTIPAGEIVSILLPGAEL